MGITRYIKDAITRRLRKHSRFLLYVPPGSATGFSLFEDLKLMIGRESPTCLDVGANEGQTIELLQTVFDKPTIHAFEPSLNVFQVLQSKARGDRVFLHNVALGKEPGKREFINYKNAFLSSFLPLDPHEENCFRAEEIESKQLAEINTVDRFLQEHGIAELDLLKIDTQGFDLEVLLGAVGALQSGAIRNVLIELNFIRLYEGQSSALDIIDLLAKHNIFLVDYYEKVRRNNTIAWCTALFGRR